MSSVTSIISTVSALLLFTGAFFTIMLKVDLAPHFYASTAVKVAICLRCLILLFAGEYYDSVKFPQTEFYRWCSFDPPVLLSAKETAEFYSSRILYSLYQHPHGFHLCLHRLR